jgi:hypothetical protein
MTIFELVAFEAPDHLTIALPSSGAARRVFGDLAMTYRVLALTPRSSRLVVKLTFRYPPGLYGAWLRCCFPALDLVMMRRQLLNLKRLAESESAECPPPEEFRRGRYSGRRRCRTHSPSRDVARNCVPPLRNRS